MDEKNREDLPQNLETDSNDSNHDPFSENGRLNSKNPNIPVINSGRNLDGGPFPSEKCFSEDSSSTNSTVPKSPSVTLPNKNKNNKKKKKNIATLTYGQMVVFLAVCVCFSFFASFFGNLLLSELGIVPKFVNKIGGSTWSEKAVPDDTDSSNVISKIADSVVEITVSTKQTNPFYFGDGLIKSGVGSGIVISENGEILTNNHVIKGAEKIVVHTKDGQEYEATRIGYDATTDIALLKIDATGLTYADIGNSDEIKVGEKAIVVGNPLGNGGTVTAGIISAKDRELVVQDGTKRKLIQTDAAINPGNSGGGLFNNHGQLVGVVFSKAREVSAEVSIEGLGFAIPINEVRDILPDLKSHGYVKGRPRLGVSLIDINDMRLASRYNVDALGVYIAKIEEGSCAQKAGLKVGDLIRAADGQDIPAGNSQKLSSIVKSHKVGDKLTLTIVRDGGSLQHIDVILEESKN